MARIPCPDKTSKEWNKLVSEVGEPRAMLSYFRHGSIPDMATARTILGGFEGVVPVLPPEVLAKVQAHDAAHPLKAAVTDVTPEGYGPGTPTVDSVSTVNPKWNEPVELQRLRTSVQEGETILRGGISGDKRVALERQVAAQKQKLESAVEERRIAESIRTKDTAPASDAGKAAEKMLAVKPVVLSKQQMIDRGAGGSLSHAIEVEIPISKIDGREPT